MAAPIVTLLTDFGVADTYAGVLEGVILGIAPSARVVHLGHGIGRGDVAAGARALGDALPHMPVGVHLAVVDPGVGSGRRAVVVATGDGRLLVGPDNGLLIAAAERCGGIATVHELDAGAVGAGEVSATFHGRDLFAPATARLAAGAAPGELGPALDADTLVRLPPEEAVVGSDWLEAAVVHVDGFGNVALAGSAVDLDQAGLTPGRHLSIRIRGRPAVVAWRMRTFADVEPLRLALLVDSSGAPALVVNGGDAAQLLGIATGDRVRIERREAW